MIQEIGFTIAVIGAVLGLIGAWATSSIHKKVRHLGFLCWTINSPLIVISLIGIVTGWWEGMTALALIVLNTVYWGTAIRGWKNTRGD
jgi:hypothetical protein